MPECLDRLAVEGEPARHDPGIDLTIRVAGVGCQKIALIGDQGSGEGWVYCTTLGRLGGRELRLERVYIKLDQADGLEGNPLWRHPQVIGQKWSQPAEQGA